MRQRPAGSTAVRAAPPVEAAEEDIAVRQPHRPAPPRATDAGAPPRHLGCRTLIVTGVPANVATRCSTPPASAAPP
ncbi:hypothetical protein ACH4JS_10810 [Streptomyces sp. NPDC017638]|uniref:hypothetical protein n=1 Tax=Streptomyces sp. NPDC017638 TaxID=3365004 RepID=UPI00378ACE8C